MKPLVLVVTDVLEEGETRWHAAKQSYLAALLEVSGVQPVLVPSIKEHTCYETLFAHADGLLLTGAKTNVHPSYYGVEPDHRHTPFDKMRDEASFALLRRALEAGLPTLSICRGHQELNTAFGGSLDAEIQDIEGRLDHREVESDDNDTRYQLKHMVKPVPGSVLAGIVGEDPIEVNSLHRQAVRQIGQGLTAEALAPDGTIEAMSLSDAPGFNLSVQWHPEYWATSDLPSRQIFEHFGREARRGSKTLQP